VAQNDLPLETEVGTTGMLCQDGAGDYYLLTPVLMAQARLDRDTGTALASRLQSSDVSGYLLPGLTLIGDISTLFGPAHTIKSPRDSASGQSTGKRGGT
jgi:hypothetical protein